VHPRLTLAISIMEAFAIFAYAISGLIEARKRRLDVVGAFLVALATAFGGATRLFDQRALLIADAVGLGLFSISGTSIALDAQMPAFVAAMMGVVTGVFGGIMRDVLCNEVPLILRDSRPYAVCAFAGCWLYLGLDWLGLEGVYNVLVSTGFILIARLVTLKLDVRLPH